MSQQELHEVSTTEIQLVLTTFNRIFFPGAPIAFVYEFTTDARIYGSCTVDKTRTPSKPVALVSLNKVKCKNLPDYPSFDKHVVA
jgi:hypothetical protein